MPFRKLPIEIMTANTTLARLQQLLPQLFEPVIVSGNPYLRFQLTAEIPALLPMERVQEALLVPAGSISPLPNLPDLTIGMMNSRDRVFCVVDLAHLLGLPPMSTQPRDYQVIVIRLPAPATEALSTEKYLGLAVRQVRGVARLELEQLRSIQSAEFPECLEPYAIGCVVEGSERLLVLDPVKIATSGF